MVVLAWMSGIAVGLVFMAAKPWAPGPIGLLSMVYQRANMVASGKMFVANSLPPFMLSMFDWNPLFHIIDQTRGFAQLVGMPQEKLWLQANMEKKYFI